MSFSVNKTLLLLPAFIALPVVANGADGSVDHASIESITVTAQKRAEDIQRVPIAITALNADDLEKKGLTDFRSIAAATPSITFQPLGGIGATSNAPRVFMRGQGNPGDPQVVNSEGSVGLYIDGFYLARPQAAGFDMADLERVEVLRGPQGTLYGKNTTGGAINFISKAPKGEFGVSQTLDFGNRDMYRSLTSVDLPEWNNISARVTALKSGVDGYVKNIGPSNDFGLDGQLAGRLQLRWAPTESFHADYFLNGGKSKSTPYYTVNSNPALEGKTIPLVNEFGNPVLGSFGVPTTATYHGAGRQDATFAPIDQTLNRAHFLNSGLTLSWDALDGLTLKSLTGFGRVETKGAYQGFGSNTGLDIFTSRWHYKQHQVSQEFQAIGNFLNDQISYVTGLYYFNEGAKGLFHVVSGNSFYLDQDYNTPKAEAESMAAYGQLTWTPNIWARKLSFTLGSRFTRDKRTVHGVGTFGTFPIYDETVNVTYHRFNPAFTAQYQWTDDVGTYAKISTGYRAGGAFFGGAPAPNNFGPESLISYEAGLKSFWFDHRLRLNVAAFHNNFKDMQTEIARIPFGTSFINLGKATINGVEVEAQANVTEDLKVGVDYAFLDARLNRLAVVAGDPILNRALNPLSPYNAGDNAHDLFAMPSAPKHSISISGDYSFLHFDNGDLTLHVDYRWQDKTYGVQAGKSVPGRELNSQPSYGLVNARLTYAADIEKVGHVSVGFWAKNLFDKQYLIGVPQVYGTQVATSAGAAGFGPNVLKNWAEPRTYGVTLSYKY